MEALTDLKAILHSKRANTTCILLGMGTSITQVAMRMLASAGVLVGFSGSGGTLLIAASEVEWLTP